MAGPFTRPEEQREELHAAEARLQGIQGSISTQDRHNQGKRDNR